MSLAHIALAWIFWVSVATILYVYFGYPVLIALLARVWRRPARQTEHCPDVTVLIAAYNEEAVIREKLENTLCQQYPREKMQIIVAADGSSDQTPEIVKEFADRGVELSYIPERGGKMAAITRAMKQVRAEIIVFSDANNQYEPSAIQLLVAPFADPAVGATTGAKLIIEDGRSLSSAEGLYWKYESSIKANESDLHSCVTSTGEILAMRRDLFSPPQQRIINDDFYLTMDVLRKGYRMIYVPSARSYEYVSATARDEIDRRLRVTAGMYQTIFMSGQILPFRNPWLVFQIVSHKYLRLLVPFAMIGAFVSNLALVLSGKIPADLSWWSLTWPYGEFFLGFQVFFYAVAMLGNFTSHKGPIGKLLYVPSFLVNSNYAGLVGFYTYLTNRKPHIWKRVRRVQ
jgi:cellulose synthase/poly-beta-1,6-N-acetylglucosamine synthase-like glycosyltransferase